MLIEFKVGNFLSFKDVVTFSMVASSDRDHLDTNTIPVSDKLRLLKSAVLYGANASGKSNLIKAIYFMTNSILSFYVNKDAFHEHFRFSAETEGIPSTFEITFLIDNIRYRYGFQTDGDQVHNEWLFYVPSIREATLFTREKEKIKLGPNFKEGKGLESKTKPDVLFLSVVDQFNGATAKKILKWISTIFINPWGDTGGSTLSNLEKKDFKKFMLQLLQVADMGIKDIYKEHYAIDKGKSKIEQMFELKTIHQKYDKNNKPVSEVKLDFYNNESTGTQFFFELAAPIYHALKNDIVLVVDELTAKLHPLLTRAVIDLFHHTKPPDDKDPGSKSQLIFACHDTNILTNQFFRRDQIWFTQKDEYGATELYSLNEYKVRKDASFNKDYIMGKYGAIPFIGDTESLSEDNTNEA